MLWLCLASIGFILYTYAGFPLLLHIRARGKQLPIVEQPPEDSLPTVSIVIAAHNERDGLPGKLASLEVLDYPKSKIEWIVVSDGSTDGTDTYLQERFEGHANRTVLHLEEALGKCGALNEGVALASGEIILFMDARQVISTNAAMALVPYLADESIGAVTGELVLSEDCSLEASNFGLYWRYEKWIRDNESRLFSTTGVTGALYAIRRKDFIPNAIGTVLDDFDTPISLLKQGKRTLYVPGAYAFDKANDDIALEFRRKVRTLWGNWQSYSKHAWLFSLGKNPVWWQFLSHKVFRLLVPYAMILTLISSAVGALFGNSILQFILFAQVAFYALAAASFAGLPGTRNKVLNVLNVFLQLNAAALVATLKYFFVGQAIRWR